MKTHSPLKYYREQQELLNEYIPKVNRIYKRISKFTDDDMFNDICRWSDVTLTKTTIKIDFCFTSKEEYTAIKNALKIHYLKKHTDERSYSMTCIRTGIIIRFWWNLPDTCEVIKEYEYEDTHWKPDEIKIDGDSVRRRVGKTVSVKCGDKSMLEAVFGEAD